MKKRAKQRHVETKAVWSSSQVMGWSHRLIAATIMNQVQSQTVFLTQHYNVSLPQDQAVHSWNT